MPNVKRLLFRNHFYSVNMSNMSEWIGRGLLKYYMYDDVVYYVVRGCGRKNRDYVNRFREGAK